MFSFFKGKKGFTLLELVVVISVIAILALIAVPTTINQIERSRFSRVKADLDSIIKAVDLHYIERGELPEDLFALREHLTRISATNPYGGVYRLGEDIVNPWVFSLKIADIPPNRKVELMNSLPNSALVRGQYHHILRGGFVGWTLQDFIDEGYTIVSNLEGLQNMTTDGRYVLSTDIVVDGDFTPIEGFTGVLVGRGHRVQADGRELFRNVEGSLVDIVLEGINSKNLAQVPQNPVNEPTPTSPPPSTGGTWLSDGYVVQVAGGGNQYFALTIDGKVYGWGRNNFGQLGLGDSGDSTNRNTPQEVTILRDKNIVQIETGTIHVLALTADGNVYSWGNNSNGQLGLGDSGDNTSRSTPQEVTALRGKNIVKIIATGFHSLALTADGNVYSWGWNDSGQLGLGHTTDQHTPQEITTLRGKNIVQIAGGSNHSLALTADGKVYSWGRNTQGELGLGDSGNTTARHSPQEITTLRGKNIVQITAGQHSSFALIANGNVYSWGWNLSGELGLGFTGGNRNTPQEVTALSGKAIVQIEPGSSHVLALTIDGEVYSWGSGDSGRLGLGDTTRQGTPQRITELSDKNIVKVTAGITSSFALTADGNVYSWGGNNWCQLGLGDTLRRLTPTIIPYFEAKNAE